MPQSIAAQKLREFIPRLEPYCHHVVLSMLKGALEVQDVLDAVHGVKVELAKDKDITEFEMTVRLDSRLREMGIKTLGQLASMREAEFLRHKSVGKKALIEARELLENNGLTFSG